MDDEATFGPVFHKLTFGQAIAQDLLTDYQVAIIGVDDAATWRWPSRRRSCATAPARSPTPAPWPPRRRC